MDVVYNAVYYQLIIFILSYHSVHNLLPLKFQNSFRKKFCSFATFDTLNLPGYFFSKSCRFYFSKYTCYDTICSLTDKCKSTSVHRCLDNTYEGGSRELEDRKIHAVSNCKFQGLHVTLRYGYTTPNGWRFLAPSELGTDWQSGQVKPREVTRQQCRRGRAGEGIESQRICWRGIREGRWRRFHVEGCFD